MMNVRALSFAAALAIAVAIGPIMAASGEEPHGLAVPAYNQPIARMPY
jgi:hypothetical protein